MRSYVVITGSMEPSIQAGSIIIVKKEQQYYPGDIITFKKGMADITHRIISSEVIQNKPYYQTKGDVNTAIDTSYVSRDLVSGKMILHIPLAGKFVLFLKTVPGLFLCIIFPGIMFLITEFSDVLHPKKKLSEPSVKQI